MKNRVRVLIIYDLLSTHSKAEIYDSLKYNYHAEIFYYQIPLFVINSKALVFKLNKFIKDHHIEIFYPCSYNAQTIGSKLAISSNFKIFQTLKFKSDFLSSLNFKSIYFFLDYEKKLLFIIEENNNFVRIVPKEDDIYSYVYNNFRLNGGYFHIKKVTSKTLLIASFISSNIKIFRLKGLNIPLVWIQDFLKRKQTYIFQNNKVMVSRKLDIQNLESINIKNLNIFLDLDGTLFDFNEKLIKAVHDLLLLSFKHKIIIRLITRHEGDVKGYLVQKDIDLKFLNEIIQITDKTKKSLKITLANSIFIDNEFPERLDVFMNKNLIVFDIDVVSDLNNFLIKQLTKKNLEKSPRLM
jgi:hypothetical protein